MIIKVYLLTFVEAIDGKKTYVFGSLSAIYTKFTEEQIGCKVTNLWNVNISQESPYSNHLCKIEEKEVIRTKTNRGGKRNERGTNNSNAQRTT